MPKKRFYKKAAKSLVISFIVNTAYITSISTLIPIVFLILFPQGVVVLTERIYKPLFLSIALIAASAAVLFLHRKSKKKTLRDFGMMTLVPGSAALVFMLFGKKAIAEILKRYTVNLYEIDLIVNYVDSTLPKLWILIAGYIFIGAAFMYLGRRLNH